MSVAMPVSKMDYSTLFNMVSWLKDDIIPMTPHKAEELTRYWSNVVKRQIHLSKHDRHSLINLLWSK